MQEVHYYKYYVLNKKYFLDHNVQYPICHHRFLKPSTISIHRSHGHKNTPPFRYLIQSANDYLSSLISFRAFMTLQMSYIMVNSEDTNMTYGKGKYLSGTDIA